MISRSPSPAVPAGPCPPAPSSSASQLQLNALQQPLSILSVTKVIIPSPAYRTTPRQCGLVSTSADFNLQPAT
ncbi:unnamed protein product [Rangifer tarandus platyrhynchus]|uniref:Uncharacterized protein n=1 Tax=Rangifer tarandus platyrhynchus TaxID=3082113 RepID=A0AC59ZAR3_RANTA